MCYYKGKRVLVTGSGGFIGLHLCRTLEELGASVLPFDHVTTGDDVTVRSHVESAFASFAPDIVFHLAAQTEVEKSYRDYERFYRTNVVGTLNVLSASRLLSQHPRIVYASTDKVYGNTTEPYREGSYKVPSPSPYGRTKAVADLMCEDFRSLSKAPIRCVRSVNTYGPGQLNKTTLITRSVFKCLAGGKPDVTVPDVKREWLYIDDAVSAFLLVGAVNTHQYAFNVGSGDRFTNSEVVKHVLRELGRDENKYNEVKSQYYDYDQSVSSEKFRAWFTDWTPTPFADGIRKTIEWYKTQVPNVETADVSGVSV